MPLCSTSWGNMLMEVNAGDGVDLVDIDAAGGGFQQEIDARHALAFHRAVTFHGSRALLGLFRRQIGGNLGLRAVEQVLVLVVVEFARGQDFAGQGSHGRLVTQHRAFQLTAGDAALDDDLAVVLPRASATAASSSFRSCGLGIPTDEPRLAGLTNIGNGRRAQAAETSGFSRVTVT